VRPRSFHRHFVAFVVAVGLALLATSCSSPAPTKTAVVIPKTNTGLCKLVPPSVVATALEESMAFPQTLTHGSTTECVYRGVHATAAAVIIRFYTDTSVSSFGNYKTSFEREGLKLGPITGLGDQAYYFAAQAGHATVTTVVLLKGSLQVLVTGTAALDPIGSIARFTLAVYEARHGASASSP